MEEIALKYLDFCGGEPSIHDLKQWCLREGVEFTPLLLNTVLSLSLND